VLDTNIVELSDLEWRILEALKRELTADEITGHPWTARAEEAGVPLEEFLRVARDLNRRGVIGRFSTFLEHYKPNAAGERVTRYNALFHWRVPQGREIDAGREVGRHFVMTHAYWREGGPDFGGVNIMGVAHGTEKETVLAHKAAIDQHLEEAGIPSATRTSSGAGAARSSRPRSRRSRTRSGAAAAASTPTRCAETELRAGLSPSPTVPRCDRSSHHDLAWVQWSHS
jgi:DNA-binding Lrp family transcriptional regulator